MANAFPPFEARTAVDKVWSRDGGASLRIFADRWNLLGRPLARTRDAQLRKFIDQEIETGRLLVVRAGSVGEDRAARRADQEQRDLIRKLQAELAGPLVVDGTPFQLLTAAQFRDRKAGFQVVRHAEGVAVLGRAAERAGASPDLPGLVDAIVALLSEDWIPPFEPKGLVLLRRAPKLATEAEASEPASTPSALHVAEKKLTFYSVTVVDEVGAAVDGIDVTFTVAGVPIVLPTDGAGKARLDDIEARGTAKAVLTSLAQVRDKMKPRWKEPREARLPTGSDVAVRELGPVVDGVSVPEATSVIVVLTPFFECREVAGTHFDFGRSFVKSSAIPLLADIAETLGDTDGLRGMIFGHTDLSGPEALNKELSERRAKAVHALLTHDATAWEELFTGSADGPNWKEKWDLDESQHMLNALGVTDDGGSPLDEDGISGDLTKQAIHRFQRGDYPDKPAEQGALPESDTLGQEGRRELFLAYAKLISRQPVDPGQFSKVGDAPFMGCGEYNPLSLSRKDAESRRTVVFLFTPAAEPQGLPCKLRSLGPCLANVVPLPTAPDPDGKPPYRCKVYQKVAKRCPCQAGVDLSHDVLVRVPVSLAQANELSHVFVLDSDDGTVHIEHKLAADARALDSFTSELHFAGLPETHSYRLTYQVEGETNLVFDFTPYDELPDLVVPGPLTGDTAAVATRLATFDGADDSFADAVAPVTDPNATADDTAGDPSDGDARGATT